MCVTNEKGLFMVYAQNNGMLTSGVIGMEVDA